MQNKLPSWDDLRVLLEVQRQGTFLGAGTQLGLSTSTVARRIGSLEQQLGTTLVHRTSQGVRLEPAARHLALLAENFERSLAVRRRDRGGTDLSGTVRLSLPDGFAADVTDALGPLLREHPALELEPISESRFVDLTGREADLAIRGARSHSPALLERPLLDVQTGLFASRAYLDAHLPGRHLTAAQWPLQRFLVDDTLEQPRGLTQWLRAQGATRFPFVSNVVEARVAAARQGLGLLLLTLDRPFDLEPVKVDRPLPALRFHLVMHRELRTVPRIRAVARALEGAISR